MYERILIATDGSELAGRALANGLELAKLVGAEVTILTVTEPAVVLGGGYASMSGASFDPVPQLIEAQEDAARRLLELASEQAVAAGVEAKTVLVTDTFPADGITATAERIGAGLIVMGSHGRRGIGRLLLGSQTNSVLAHTQIPVLVIR